MRDEYGFVLAKIRVWVYGSLEGGVGCGSGEARVVSDLKFQNVMSWSKIKKNSFFGKAFGRMRVIKLLELTGDKYYNVL